MLKPVVHLVSNAHLDPVWSWPWDEGLVEALATFRIAVHFLDQYPEYVFVRGESLLYEWVEAHDPATFARVREFIRSGRWVIVGGWYLQPDCNLPGGESFVRQALVGKSYFIEKFGVEPIVAYNVDSFGHNGGLPQIMRLSGSPFYIHFRPSPHEMALPEIFRWRGVDGSEVITARPLLAGYCTEPGIGPDKARQGIDLARETHQDVLLFWGVGDHGGGATRSEMDQMRTLASDSTDVELRHSHPLAFFEAYLANQPDLPVVEGDMQHCFTGCYTSGASLKRAHRHTEGLLAQTERLAALANSQTGWPYPKSDLDSLWKDLLFTEFHDSLAGTTSKASLQDLLDIFGRCQQSARRIRLGAVLALAADLPQVSAAIPIHVFNPHAFPYSGPVDAEFMLDYRPQDWTGKRLPVEVIAPDGKITPSQEGIPTFIFPLDWRKKLSFWAEIPPLSSLCYQVRPLEPESSLPSPFHSNQTEVGQADASLADASLVVENGRLRAAFNRQNGLLTSILDLETGREYLSGEGIRPLAIADPGDTWGTNVSSYRTIAGYFRPASPQTIGRLSGRPGQVSPEPPLKVIEDGALRWVVDSILEYGDSTLVLRFTLFPNQPFLELDLKVDWREPNHMLKLSVPTALQAAQVRCEIPYGAIQRPADGAEQVGQRWVLLESEDASLGLINTGQYGFDVLDGDLRLSLLRSPQYSALSFNGQVAQLERTPDFMDLGQHEIHLALSVGPIQKNLPAVIRLAQQTNIPAVVLPYFQTPEGQVPRENETRPYFLSVEPTTVVLGALKQAEDGSGLLIRLHESIGVSVNALVRIASGQPISISFGPYELKSFRLVGGSLQPCDLLERPI